MVGKKNNILLNNTIMLYILTFSNYFFGFITVPYQTRILGPEIYGKVGFAMAFSVYFQLFLDFGFILSSTAEVAMNKEDNNKLSRIISNVLMAKFILIIISFLILLSLFIMVPKLQEDMYLYLLFFAYSAVNSLLPDYLYRGLERMKVITYRTIMIKVFFTIMIVILLKNKTQYYYIPILNMIGALVAVVFAYVHVITKLKIHLKKVKFLEVRDTLKNSSFYFYSRIATSIYDATNTFILGFVYPTGNVIGYFTSSNKLITTARSGFSPIADSLYPYMIKTKNYKLIGRILYTCMPFIIMGCIVIGIYAEPICIFLFGKEYSNAADLLRLLLPLIVLGFPNYILGFPTLTPLGLAKYANISTIVGAGVHVLGLITMFLFGLLNVYTICILTGFTELCILMVRVIVIWKNYKYRKGFIGQS